MGIKPINIDYTKKGEQKAIDVRENNFIRYGVICDAADEVIVEVRLSRESKEWFPYEIIKGSKTGTLKCVSAFRLNITTKKSKKIHFEAISFA